jgi:hypothetical protein
MKNTIISVIAGMMLAIVISFLSHDNAIQNVMFRTGLYDRETEKKTVQETLKLFNRNFATFFNTGGNLSGLNEFPAENMIKRRIFQEINKWTKNNQIIVYDKDVFEIESIDFPDPDRATAVTREVWFLNIQEKETRKHLSPVKASSIRVRYIMKKIEGNWRVLEYEVFADTDDIPAMRMERF